MKQFFKSLWTFIKKPAVKLWLISMAVVIIVTVSVLSIVMLTNHMDFGAPLRPYRADIHSIHIGNGTSGPYGRLQTNNFRRNNEESPNPTYQPGGNEIAGGRIQDILDLLHEAGRTTRFAQVLGGQAYGPEVISSPPNRSFRTLSDQSGNNFILITFAVPVYVVIRDGTAGPFRIERFNPLNPPSEDLTNPIVQSIFIPLNNITNTFAEHTWHLRMGRRAMDVTNEAGFHFEHTFTTFGNYYKLFNHIQSLDL